MNIPEFYKKFFIPGIISTDSRDIKHDSIFFALRGECFNGNTFALSALESGAKVAVVDELIKGPEDKLIKVENSLSYMQELATYHRQQQKFRILGITGSNGKTTTKELIYSVLSQKFKVQSTQGNLNNHIGVPLTLLSMLPETEIGIVEMGANHPGEIAILCDIAQPDYGLITNIGKAHLEGFNGFEGVVKTKSELFNYLKQNKGTIYYNDSDQLLVSLVDRYENAIRYGKSGENYSGRVLKSVPLLEAEIIVNEQKIVVSTKLYGDYNLNNILAASCIGAVMGLSPQEIKKGIESYIPSNYRSQVVKIGSASVVMDCYNANPSSMEHALKNLHGFKTGMIAVLGGMKELGKESLAEHRKIASLAESLGIEKIILFGPEFREIKVRNSIQTESFEELTVMLNSLDLNHKTILIKGSRANKLERLEQVINNYFGLEN